MVTKRQIKKELQNIRILAMDFDGVHTDGFVYLNQKGEEMVRCSRRDSLGLEMLKHAGIKLVVISKEKNSVVVQRCKKLGIDCFCGVADSAGKRETLERFVERAGLSAEQVLFIGDDVNDIDSLIYAGVAVAPQDAHIEVKKVCDIVLSRQGGDHALRELADMILCSRETPLTY